jgi:5'-nucleotidase
MQRCHTLYASAILLALLPSAHAQTFKLEVIALNDLHGNLQSPGTYRANAQSPEVPAGGVALLAGYVRHLKSQNPNNIVVSAGDLTGGGPLISALFHDEDTVEVMNRIGLDINGVGNHEFDHGKTGLMRLAHGGCSTADANTCRGAETGMPVPFEGAKFEYLAANVIDTATDKTIFPGYTVRTFNGVKIGFVGLTLAETPTIVSPGAVAGLRFEDEATTINDIVRRLRPQGVRSFVVLLHQGGRQTTQGTPDINACEGGLQGTPVRSIVEKLDSAVDLVVSAHTHLAYVCQIPNRSGHTITVTSAASYGRLITRIDLTIEKATGKVTAVVARNIVVDRNNADGIAPDPTIESIVDKYALLVAPIVDRVVGSVATDIPKKTDGAGESAIGDLIADAQLAVTRAPGKADMAFMNEGGVRTGLPFVSRTPGVKDGMVTYGELYTAQPFGNTLVTMSLTGAQVKDVLEEQFKGCAIDAGPGDKTPDSDRRLFISEGLTYTFNPTAAPCHKIDSASLRLNGTAIVPGATYRVTVNSLLASGGEQIFVLRRGTDLVNGPIDIDAMIAYLAAHPGLKPVESHRVVSKPD